MVEKNTAHSKENHMHIKHLRMRNMRIYLVRLIRYIEEYCNM
jgi:hypothetical protein